MIRPILTLAALVLAATLTVPSALANPLVGLKGEKRVVLLFAKSRSDAGLDKQVELFRERRPALRGRDMLVIVVEGTQDAIPAIGYAPLPSGSGRDLRKMYEPAARGFTGILIGKDGTEKERWQSPAEPDRIFALVDAMPVRAREVEEQTSGTATN
jgi:hypothetical protein